MRSKWSKIKLIVYRIVLLTKKKIESRAQLKRNKFLTHIYLQRNFCNVSK